VRFLLDDEVDVGKPVLDQQHLAVGVLPAVNMRPELISEAPQQSVVTRCRGHFIERTAACRAT
jgi:hypothetical protein